jgi:hypothetical protein
MMSFSFQSIIAVLNKANTEIVDGNFRLKTVYTAALLVRELDMKFFQHFDFFFSV